MAEKYNICLDIGGTKVLGAVFDSKDNIVYRYKKKSAENGASSQNVEEVIVSVVDELLKSSGIKKSQLNAISAGAPGVIDQGKGIILFTPNLPFRNYDIKTPMEKKFGVPFYIGNDVNVGVLGEYKYGAAKGYQHVIGFFVGTGMGGGLILNGSLYTGNQFKAAEYGHMILDPEGPMCGCGQRGCLEAFSSKKGISDYIRQQVSRGRESEMAEQVQNGVFRSKYLKKALQHKDQVTMEAIDRACHYLAIGAGNLINTFSPEVVVFGGGVVEATGDLIRDKVLAEIDKYCMPSIRTTVELKTAALGDDSNIYGSLAMIHEAEGTESPKAKVKKPAAKKPAAKASKPKKA
ncbi:MAG: ROK family protein [Lachnospiraceae bacterium]|nr:ROK family protein [Lachnospiraceae bacterium]